MPKICPLFRVGEMISGVHFRDISDCIGIRCAWYDKGNKCCVLITLAESKYMHEALSVGGWDDEAEYE